MIICQMNWSLHALVCRKFILIWMEFLNSCQNSIQGRLLDLTPIVLKELRVEIAPVICLLFERSLRTVNCLQNGLKLKYVPFSRRDKSDPANYRPISLTCILCKVMEHIIASNTSKHHIQHDILYELQHGFREKRSCETQLIQLVEDLSRQLTLRNQT